MKWTEKARCFSGWTPNTMEIAAVWLRSGPNSLRADSVQRRSNHLLLWRYSFTSPPSGKPDGSFSWGGSQGTLSSSSSTDPDTARNTILAKRSSSMKSGFIFAMRSVFSSAAVLKLSGSSPLFSQRSNHWPRSSFLRRYISPNMSAPAGCTENGGGLSPPALCHCTRIASHGPQRTSPYRDAASCG